jgi:hypothetical protein
VANFWDMVKEYRKRFNESYPIYWMNHLTEDEQIQAIAECLRTGEPIKPQYEPDKDY